MLAYLLCDDLMWMSRVMAEAKDLGGKVIPARTVEQLRKAITANGPHCVIIDLAQAEVGADPTPIVETLKTAGIQRFVAYGSHIETAQLASARNAGCHPTLARSKMAAELRTLLPEWMSDSPG
ncbi:MAG: hypothetical protein U0796_09190 [Gemmatales bacterium]